MTLHHGHEHGQQRGGAQRSRKIMPGGARSDEFIDRLCQELNQRFGIEYSTIQIETGDHACRLAPANVV